MKVLELIYKILLLLYSLILRLTRFVRSRVRRSKKGNTVTSNQEDDEEVI